MQTFPRLRRRATAASLALVLATTALAALPAGADSAPMASAVELSGAPCAPGTGVTVVVDFTALSDDVRIGCAPGEQASGLAALAAAGFTTTDAAGPGTVRTIDGLPTQPYPYGWSEGGNWSYWHRTSDEPWESRLTGPTVGPLPVDSIEGWSWAPDFEDAAPRADGTPDGDAPVVSITAEPPDPTNAARASSSFTVDDPAPLACDAPASGTGGSGDALDWLACELDASNGLFGATFDGEFFVDAGLTMDALLSFALFDRADDAAVQASLEALDDEVASYITGFGEPTDRTAGGTAKTLLTAILVGEGEDHFGPFDLEGDLRALMQTSGPQSGRFTDRNTFGDFSNGFGQTLAVMALSHTDDGVPAPAIEFLLDQQCPSGGFRGVYSGTPGCDGDAEADTDYTALTIQALLTSRKVPGVDAAVNEGAAWLLDQQDAATGAIGGTGPTAGSNTNSSGLSAQALRAAGRGPAADKAAAWVATQQITATLAGSGPAREDLGAIAYDSGALTEGVTSGITELTRDQWRRATIQGVLAFEAPTLGVLPNMPPPSRANGHALGHPRATRRHDHPERRRLPARRAGHRHALLQPCPARYQDRRRVGWHQLHVRRPRASAWRPSHRARRRNVRHGRLAVLRSAGCTGRTVGSDEPDDPGPTAQPGSGALQPAGSGSLARTGTDVLDLVPLAIALTALGLALVATARRRRLAGSSSP